MLYILYLPSGRKYTLSPSSKHSIHRFQLYCNEIQFEDEQTVPNFIPEKLLQVSIFLLVQSNLYIYVEERKNKLNKQTKHILIQMLKNEPMVNVLCGKFSGSIHCFWSFLTYKIFGIYGQTHV